MARPGGVTFRGNNPYARRSASLWRLLFSALPFMVAPELDYPPRLKFKARGVRTVPPILDQRPIDIYRTVTTVYSIPGSIPVVYVSQPEELPA